MAAAGVARAPSWPAGPAEADAGVAPGRRRPTPSAGCTRRASSRRPRTACTSRRSTSRPSSRAQLVALLRAWTEAADRMTRGLDAGEVGAVDGPDNLPPDDTGEALGLPRRRADHHLRLRPRRCSATPTAATASAWRPAARGARAAAALPGRHPRPGALGRRPLRAGLRRRPAGRGARDPQPRPDRLRHRLGALVAARLRAHVDHLRRRSRRRATSSASRTARPTSRRRRPPPSTSTSGSAPTTTRGPAGWPAGPTSSRAGSTWPSRSGTGSPWPSRRRSSAGTKGTGAPLSGRHGALRPPTSPCPAPTRPIIPVDAHVRVVHPDQNGGARMLRRGYNFVDGRTRSAA